MQKTRLNMGEKARISQMLIVKYKCRYSRIQHFIIASKAGLSFRQLYELMCHNFYFFVNVVCNLTSSGTKFHSLALLTDQTNLPKVLLRRGMWPPPLTEGGVTRSRLFLLLTNSPRESETNDMMANVYSSLKYYIIYYPHYCVLARAWRCDT